MPDTTITSLDGEGGNTEIAQQTVQSQSTAQNPIGQIENAEGSVTVMRADGNTETLQEGDALYQGDTLTTGGEGSVGVILSDGTTFSMAESGQIALDEMVYDASTSEGSLALSVAKGVFTMISGEIAKANPDAMTLNTPSATIGIRGTQVGLDVPADGQAMNVVLMKEADGFVGEVVVQNAAGAVALNQAHQGISVASAQSAPSSITTFTNSQIVDVFGKAFKALPANGNNANNYGQEKSSKENDDAAKDDANVDDASIEALADFETAAGGEDTPGGDATPGSTLAYLDWSALNPAKADSLLKDFNLDFLDLSSFDVTEGTDGDDNLTGGTGNDVISGGQGNDTIDGGEGDDVIDGGEGDDEIEGDEGDDWLFGNDGNDIIDGGTGDDTIAGGAGDDLLLGSEGDDTISGDAGDDIIVGNDGNDIIDGGTGDDTIAGGAGDDRLLGSEGDDTIAGNAGDDIIEGNDGNDIIDGGTGDDTIDGGAGDDVINGGAGDDKIIAREGADIVNGGEGNDLIITGGNKDVEVLESAGDDHIAGFAGAPGQIKKNQDDADLNDAPVSAVDQPDDNAIENNESNIIITETIEAPEQDITSGPKNNPFGSDKADNAGNVLANGKSSDTIKINGKGVQKEDDGSLDNPLSLTDSSDDTFSVSEFLGEQDTSSFNNTETSLITEAAGKSSNGKGKDKDNDSQGHDNQGPDEAQMTELLSSVSSGTEAADASMAF